MMTRQRCAFACTIFRAFSKFKRSSVLFAAAARRPRHGAGGHASDRHGVADDGDTAHCRRHHGRHRGYGNMKNGKFAMYCYRTPYRRRAQERDEAHARGASAPLPAARSIGDDWQDSQRVSRHRAVVRGEAAQGTVAMGTSIDGKKEQRCLRCCKVCISTGRGRGGSERGDGSGDSRPAEVSRAAG